MAIADLKGIFQKHSLQFMKAPLFMDLWEEAKIKGAMIQTIKHKEDLEGEIEKFVFHHWQNAQYFISGKPDFSKPLIKRLKENSVTRITKDIFTGY